MEIKSRSLEKQHSTRDSVTQLAHSPRSGVSFSCGKRLHFSLNGGGGGSFSPSGRLLLAFSHLRGPMTVASYRQCPSIAISASFAAHLKHRREEILAVLPQKPSSRSWGLGFVCRIGRMVCRGKVPGASERRATFPDDPATRKILFGRENIIAK